MRKLLSFLSSLAIVGTLCSAFVVSSHAATGDAKLKVDVGVDQYNYYYVNFLFSVDKEMGVTVSKTERGTNFYSGTGILGVALNIKSLDSNAIYSTESHILSSGKQENTDSKYGYTNAISSVEELAGTGEQVNLVKINTNYSNTDKTEKEIVDMFSNFGYVAVKTVTVTDVKAGTNVSDQCVTYAISEPGSKHVDADYSIIIGDDTTPAKEGLTQADGDKTFYTPEAVEFTGDSITVKVTNDKVTGTKIEETLEKAGSVLGGKTKLLPIIKYTPSDALKGSTFTIEIGDKTYTYAIAE